MRRLVLLIVLLVTAAVLTTPAQAQFNSPPWDNDPATTNRVPGDTPIDYAINLSQQANPDFPAFRIGIVSDSVFADGLSSSGLSLDSIFFAGPGQPLTDATLAEIRRVHGDSTEVLIIGGPAVVDPQVEAQLTGAGITFTRLDGPDRIGTSLAVADQVVEQSFADEVAQVVIARAFEAPGGSPTGAWADSISAAGSVQSTPLLLNPTATLDPRVREWLVAHTPTSAVLLGGTAALSDAVREEIAALGISVRRVAGPTRDATAAAIARQVGSSFFGLPDQMALVNLYDETGWAYALATAQRGFGMPLLTVSSPASPFTQAIAACGPPTDIVVAGPESVVPQAQVDAARTCPEEGSYGQNPAAPLSLRGDGLGDTMFFGANVDVVVERLTATFGEPTDDTGWLDDACVLAGPEDPPARFVSFGDLTVGFREVAGLRFFERWTLRGPGTGLATPEGIAHGASNAQVRSAYGAEGQFTPSDEGFPPPLWSLRPEHGALLLLSGGNGDDATLTDLWGGNAGFCE